jgi:hypothetical protein
MSFFHPPVVPVDLMLLLLGHSWTRIQVAQRFLFFW